MHVLFATPAFPPFNGGGERYAGALAAHLAGRGHQITVLTSQARREAELWSGATGDELQIVQQEGLTVIRVPVHPMPGGRSGLLAWRKGMVLLSALPGTTALLEKMARRIPGLALPDDPAALLVEPVDLVHGFNLSWEYAALYGWGLARARDLPFVISPFAHLGSGPRDRVAFNSTMSHQLAMLDGAAAVLTLTEPESRGLQAHGVRRPLFAAVGSGLDPLPPLEACRVETTVDEPYVIYVGRASHDKGAMHAAQAIMKLRAQGTAVRLAMIGHETEMFNLFLEGLAPAQREAVLWLGPLDDAAKHAWLEGAAALLLPSQTDSFGIVLLEAWAHGKPVIGAAAGGIPGVIDDGQNGLLVPFGDVAALAGAVARLLGDAALRERLGEHGRHKVATRYQWESVTTAVLNVYERVLHGAALPGRQPAG